MNRLFYTLLVLLLLLATNGMAATGFSGDAQINQCEEKNYVITVTNTSGNNIDSLVVTNDTTNLTGFSFVPTTSTLTAPGCSTTVDPTITGTDLIWNVDTLCPAATTLGDGQSLTIDFGLITDCSAVSGSQAAQVDYQMLGNPEVENSTYNIEVLPGAVTIKKTLNVIPQVLSQDVTWTLTVENTGFGVIKNVEVTDELGAGLAYVSSTQSGNNSGQTTTWTSVEYAALASMDPGDILTMDITATVIACDNLDNTADVRFGCDPSPAGTCFNTAVDGGSANASVQRIVRTPNLSFTPPDIDFTYCDDTETVAFTITNIGDGIAYDVYTIVDFSAFTVSNVSAGAIYNVAQGRFESADPIAASGGTYDLSFDLTYNSWCGGSFPSADLLWQKLYTDECGQEFYPPVELSAINAPLVPSSLAVSKSGAPAEIEIGGSVDYTITSSYTGQLSCDSPSSNVGLITVVDTIPNGFTVTDAGGGTWVPGGGGTGGTITWTYLPPASLNTTITVQVPDVTQCETFCNTVFSNTITASGTDCCGCGLSASDSQTTAIECAEGVTSDKTSNSPSERCTDTTYTNTYTFDGGSAVVLSDLEFTEEGQLEQEYVGGTLSVIFDGNVITGAVALTDNTPTLAGNGLTLDFSGAGGDAMAGKVLTITYDLTATANTIAACSDSTFYSWSRLDIGSSGSSCLGDGILHETTEVTVASPAMSLDITGLGQIYNSCETKTITMTLTQASDFNPKDVKLVLEGLNYFVVNPGGVVCGGSVAPAACTPVIDGNGDYIWTFNDGFAANGANSVLTLDVQKRCSGGGDLTATAHFDDACTDDATSDELCSVAATATPALLLSGDLLIEKTPETYYASTNTVQWEIYLTNRGTGTAYNVWVDDVLGAGLQYEHGVNPVVVDNMTGVTVNDSLDHNGAVINGASVEIAFMLAGERRQITFIAKQIDCSNLINTVTSNWGCIGVRCQTDVTDSSLVQIPAPNLINTNTITPAGGVNACQAPDGFITLRNAGQISTYNLQVTETLPAGLTYVSGSTRWRLNGAAWNGPNVIYDPNPTASPLVWTSTEIAALAVTAPGDTIELEFAMATDCPFSGGDITVATQYENPCGNVFNTSDSTFTAIFNEPDVTVSKSRIDQPVGCNEAVSWTIAVTNNSGYTLDTIWVEDTLDAAYIWTGNAGDGTYSVDAGSHIGQTVQWELADVPTGTTVTLSIDATTDSAPCSPNLDNTVIAWWGCGATDSDSSTKPGVDPPDNNLCLNATGIQDVRTETRQPDLSFLSIGVTPVNIDSCNDSTTLKVVIENPSPVDASNVDLQVTLPTGLTYNAGTSESGLGTDDTVPTAGIGDPALSGSTLTWYDIGDKASDLANTLQADGGNDTLVLMFDVQSACYLTDNLDFNLRYYDCCGDTQYSTTTRQSLTSLYPSLTVTKTPVNNQVSCGAQQSWTITVTNSGTGNAQVVRVEDTPGAWIDVDLGASTADLTDMGGGVYGWEFIDLAPGDSKSFTLVGTLNPDGSPNQNDCSTSLRQNNVQAVWACGTGVEATDNDPTTTAYDCEDATWTTTSPASLLMPDLTVTSINPTISCVTDGTFGSSMTVTVQNDGDGQTLANFTVQVSDGTWTGTGTYSGNVAAGASTDVTINTSGWNPDCNSCTPYNLTAIADLDNDVCECNESNNSGTQNYTAPIPKLTLTAISPTPNCNDVSSVDVTIENQGCAAVAAGVEIAITGDASGTGTTIGALAAGGGSEVVTISLGNIACGQDYDITATADPNSLTCECDATNHTQTASFNSPCCSIDLEKATNGQDADTATGPYIPVGDNVTWDYVITNSGSTIVDTIVLNDDQLGNITVSCPGTSLASGASMTCSVTTPVLVGMGNQYSNVADVAGRPVDGGGTRIGNDLTDTDPSHFYVESAAITVEKSTNGQDADGATGPIVLSGNPVTWTYLISNTGNVTLTGISLTDDILGNISASCSEGAIPDLAPAASFTCTAPVGVAVVDQYVNLATVTGTPPTGPDVQDTDPSHYFGQAASITVEKSTNGQDADTVPGPFVLIGNAVNWSYLVTNTGNVALSAISVVDDQGVVITCPQNTLAAGASMTCTAAGISVGGQYENIATATGTPPVEGDVTDTDPSHYLGPLPAIDLEKATNTEDADIPTGSFIGTGDPVTWTYVITNTGNTGLANISLIDDQLGNISNSCAEGAIPLLATGTAFTCTVSGSAIAGQYANIAEVTGEPVDNLGNPIALPPVTDSDPSHYFGAPTSIDIEKFTNGEDADAATGPELESGETVNWTYEVSNTGEIDLINIQVIDSQGVVVSCPKTVLTAGETMTCTGNGTAITGQYQNEATVTGHPYGGLPVTDSDPSHYFGRSRQILEREAISIEKDANRNSVAGGDIILYTVLVKNSGVGQAANVQVKDLLPAGFQYMPSTSILDGQRIGNPTGSTTLTWTLDHIAAGQTRTLRYQVRVPIDLPAGNYVNTAISGDARDSATVSSVQDYEECCLTVDKELITFQPPQEFIPVQQDLYFFTHMAMFASWQLAGLSDITVNSHKQGTWQYQISRHTQKLLKRADRFSKINTSILSMHSGLGLGMEYSPAIDGDTLSKRQQNVSKKINLFAAETGWQGDSSSLKPLFLEFFGAVPTRQESGDIEWAKESVDRSLSPGAWGMTLLSQSHELARLQKSEELRDGFLARVLTWQLEEKVSFLWNWLQTQPVEEHYLPHLFAGSETIPLQLSVNDASSHLFDQASMLWGLTQLQNVLVRAELPVSPELKKLIEQVWENLDAHFDEGRGVWLGRITPKNTQGPTGEEQVRVLDILLAALAVDSLQRNDDSWFTFGKYRNRINAATDFLKQRAAADGSLGDKVSLDTAEAGDNNSATLLATAALVRMELLTGDKYAALQRFANLESLFWNQDNQLYLNDAVKGYQVSYDPFIMGTFIEMLRALAALEENIESASLYRGLAFIDRIISQAELQLSPGLKLSEPSLPVLTEKEKSSRPLMVTKTETGQDNGLEKNYVPVLIRQVSLNLLPLTALPMNMNQAQIHATPAGEQSAGFALPDQLLSRSKGHLVYTETAALASFYLAETAQLLQSLAKGESEDPFFNDPYGLAEFAVETESLWQNSLLSVSLYYNQGIPLAFSPRSISLAKEKGILPQQAFAGHMDDLAEQYLNTENPELPAPLFLEYDQGEPFISTRKDDYWASRPYQEQMTLTGLSQLERNRLRFIGLAEQRSSVDNEQMSHYLGGVTGIQSAAKLEFLLDLLRKSKEQGLRFCPETLKVIKDSHGQPLDSHFVEPLPTRVGQISMLLAFADSIVLPEAAKTILPGQKDLLVRIEKAFHQQLAEFLTAYRENIWEITDNILLDQGLALDLLAQLHQHPATRSHEQETLLPLLTSYAEKLVRKTDQKRAGAGLSSSMAEMPRERNRLAAYGSVLMALTRVQEINQDGKLAKTIAALAMDFEHSLWNEKTGCYQSQSSQYRSREMQIDSHLYSELDVILSLTGLGRSLHYLLPEEQERILQHITSFGTRLLVSPQLTSKILTDKNFTPSDFDSEMLQDTEIRLIKLQNAYAGDVIQYRIRVYNRCPDRKALASPMAHVEVRDFLPPGMFYVPGSTIIDGEVAEEPKVSGERVTWQVNDLKDVSEITFWVKLSSEFEQRELKNRVEVIGTLGADRRSSFCTFSHEVVDPLANRNSVIDVHYYGDTNANNILDLGELGIAGVTTQLQGQTPISSDQAGHAVFSGLGPGIYLIRPDLQEMKQQYIATGLIPAETTIRENEEKYLSIGLIALKEIHGWAFDDRNNNGQKDSNEPPIHGLRLQLQGSEAHYAYSAADGFFKIERIPMSAGTEVQISKQQPYSGDISGQHPGFELD